MMIINLRLIVLIIELSLGVMGGLGSIWLTWYACNKKLHGWIVYSMIMLVCNAVVVCSVLDKIGEMK